MSRVIGIDFSTTCTGIAIYDENGWSTYAVKSSGKSRDDLATYYTRVRGIAANVLSIIQPMPDDLIAIEKAIVMGRRTDSEVRLHFAWHRFVECLLAWGVGEPRIVAPATAKQVGTGSGSADKKRMHAAVVSRVGLNPRTADEADAVWIAVAAAEAAGRPIPGVAPLPPKETKKKGMRA